MHLYVIHVFADLHDFFLSGTNSSVCLVLLLQTERKYGADADVTVLAMLVEELAVRELAVCL